MKKNIYFVFITSTIILAILLSGCNVIFSTTIYEPTPTKIRYEICYGYLVNCTGTGRYEIIYSCNTPKIIKGTTSYNLLYNDEYKIQTIANNTIIQWNISGKEQQTYKLGLFAQVDSESYLVFDLNGEHALTIEQILQMYPENVNNYVQIQANETTRFIDPSDPNIVTIAKIIQANSETNNSFLLAKRLFIWMKQNVKYQTHQNDQNAQPAALTLYNKVGDCDDLSFLYISLCRALNIPARFIRGYLLTNYNNGTTRAIPHAWVEVFIGGSIGISGWIPVECACCSTSIESDVNQNFGLENAFHLRLFVDDGSNESLNSLLSGISYVTYGLNRTIKFQLFAEIINYQELESKKLVVTRENTRYYE